MRNRVGHSGVRLGGARSRVEGIELGMDIFVQENVVSEIAWGHAQSSLPQSSHPQLYM